MGWAAQEIAVLHEDRKSGICHTDILKAKLYSRNNAMFWSEDNKLLVIDSEETFFLNGSKAITNKTDWNNLRSDRNNICISPCWAIKGTKASSEDLNMLLLRYFSCNFFAILATRIKIDS